MTAILHTQFQILIKCSSSLVVRISQFILFRDVILLYDIRCWLGIVVYSGICVSAKYALKLNCILTIQLTIWYLYIYVLLQFRLSFSMSTLTYHSCIVELQIRQAFHRNITCQYRLIDHVHYLLDIFYNSEFHVVFICCILQVYMYYVFCLFRCGGDSSVNV